MHKGVILLVQAEDKEDALDRVKDFMEPYGEGDVWDWYAIGGRWSNTLAPKNEEFEKWAGPFLKEKEGGRDWISQSTVDANQDSLQAKWVELGMSGSNPYANHYDLPDDGGGYDVLPLAECIETVKKWVRDLVEEEKKAWEELLAEKQKEDQEGKKPGEWGFAGYRGRRWAETRDGQFCFDSNVFDITKEHAEKLPDDLTGYWAVMVDMHN